MDVNNIIDDVDSRMKTLMIGFIDRFEQSFGYLWAHGKQPNTDQQKLFKDKWSSLRTDLLNYGNHQIRLATGDIQRESRSDKYKYHYKFINPPRENN